MCSARRLGGAVTLVILALATLAPGCDTTSPQLIDSQTVSLRVLAPTGANAVQKVRVWDTFEDPDSNGLHDPDTEGPLFLFCEKEVVPNTDPPEPVFGTASSVPWPFFARVSILRNGQTEWEEITLPDAATDENFNLAEFDTTEQSFGGGPRRAGGDVFISTGGRFFQFRNPRIVSTVNEEVIRALPGTSTLCGLIGCSLLEGLCSNVPANIKPSINGQPQPLDVQLAKGDLIRVEIGRSPDPQLSLAPLIFTNTPALRAELFVNGRRVNVEGDSGVNPIPTENRFAFTYRSR